jgi:hypothetical protein
VAGWTVDMVSVDITALYLSVSGDPRAGETGSLMFVAPMLISDRGGVERLKRDEGYEGGPEDLGPTGFINGQSISELAITLGGAARLILQGGSRIDAWSHPEYENWALTLPGGVRLVSAPGGGVLRFESKPGDKLSYARGPLKSFRRLLRKWK